MESEKKSNAAVIIFSLALLLVLALVVALFIRGNPTPNEDAIILPSVQLEPSAPSNDSVDGDTSFIQVSIDNVLPMLRAINRPSYFYQCFTVAVGSDDVQSQKKVEFWVNGVYVRGKVTHGNNAKNILSNGEDAWLWYDSDDIPVSVSLMTTTVEDLLGIPEFDYISLLEESSITDAEYLILNDPQLQCIFVCTQDESSLSRRYWIDLDSGLLYQGDILDQNRRVYELRQEQFEILAQGDQSFSGQFILPNGSDPFMETE